jgi:hypothetical protein
MKCTRIGEKSCNCSCFEIDQEMDAILLIIDNALISYKFWNFKWNFCKILKFWTFFAIWLADWKWNLVSCWTTLKPRIELTEVQPRKYYLGQSAKSKIPYHLIQIYYGFNHFFVKYRTMKIKDAKYLIRF